MAAEEQLSIAVSSSVVEKAQALKSAGQTGAESVEVGEVVTEELTDESTPEEDAQ